MAEAGHSTYGSQANPILHSVWSLYGPSNHVWGAQRVICLLGKNGGGAVVAGVNKAVQTISVFVASAIWFGPEHPEQRMTTFKVFALILVVFGVLVYSAVQM